MITSEGEGGGCLSNSHVNLPSNCWHTKVFGSDDETFFYNRENDMTLSQFDFGSWDAHSW